MSHENSALRSTRTAGVLLLCALLAGLIASPGFAEDRPEALPYKTSADVPQLSPDYQMTTHKVVLITDNALNPPSVTLDEGQLVAWISYSAKPSTVVFEREVARAMICHSLVNFSIKEDELRSAPIHAGEFASFCQLKPGRYRYKIVRGDSQQKGNAASQPLEGEIIVGNPQGS